jgi:hypothetical protein
MEEDQVEEGGMAAEALHLEAGHGGEKFWPVCGKVLTGLW